MMAVAILFTASCAKEEISSSIAGGEVEVSFTANLADLGTRAYGEGNHVTTLRYVVCDQAGEPLPALNGTIGIRVNQTVTVNLVLIKGMQYNILFWADNWNSEANSGIYQIANNGVVTVDYTGVMANDETRDAFYATVENFDPATADADDTIVTLRRPFAQLNAYTTDYAAFLKSNVTLTTSAIKTKVYSELNTFTGEMGNPTATAMLFAENANPVDENGNDDNRYHISMNYLLVPVDGCVADVEFIFNNDKGIVIPNTSYTNIPLKPNYKTNIIGALLTKPTDFEVTIEENFYTPDEDIEVVSVATAAELFETINDASAEEGKSTEIILEGDINLGNLVAGLSSTRTANPDFITIPAGKELIIDLNGCTISGTDNGTASFGLIVNKGKLTINDSKGNGKIQLTATQNRGWNAYSSVISNQPGGVLVVNGGTIEHLGGTDMAYGIDILTNGKGTSAVATINGGHIKSPYRAVRQFLNGVEANNSLTVNGGTIEGANKSIWMQDPSKNANTGSLVVTAEAQLVGDVYLFVTAGSTEWPVSVSIAEAALQGESTVISGNVPTGYEVKVVDGAWTVAHLAVGAIVEVNGVKAVIYSLTDEAVKAVSVEELNLNGKNWQNAMDWAAGLGEGWALASMEELNAIYDLRETLNDALEADSAENALFWEGDELYIKNGSVYYASYLSSTEVPTGADANGNAYFSNRVFFKLFNARGYSDVLYSAFDCINKYAPLKDNHFARAVVTL